MAKSKMKSKTGVNLLERFTSKIVRITQYFREDRLLYPISTQELTEVPS